MHGEVVEDYLVQVLHRLKNEVIIVRANLLPHGALAFHLLAHGLEQWTEIGRGHTLFGGSVAGLGEVK